MNTKALVRHARETANIDYLAKYDTTERPAALIQCAIEAGARNIAPENAEPVYKFATEEEYREARREWLAAYGERLGWEVESGTDNPGKMAWSRLGGTMLNPNAKVKVVKDGKNNEKSISLRQQLLDATFKEKNQDKAVQILALIFAKQ